MDLVLTPSRTALVVIDLQRGTVGAPTAPHPAGDVVARAAAVAGALRAAGGLIVLVHVTPSGDGKDALRPQTDTPLRQPGRRPPDWAEIVPELGPEPGDLVITKRQWGAFYGTELDLQLRRRGIDTILLAGISTNVGVESTARDAYERGYEQVFVEDAMAARNPDEHAHTVRTLFARIGRVRSTAEVLAALEAATGVARAVGLGSRTIHGVYLSPSTTTSNTTIPRAPTQPVSYRGPEGTCLRAQPNGVAGKKARHPATKVRALS